MHKTQNTCLIKCIILKFKKNFFKRDIYNKK